MNHFNSYPVLFILAVLLYLAGPAGGINAQTPRIAVTGAIDWKKMEMTVNMALDLASAGVSLPARRAQA